MPTIPVPLLHAKGVHVSLGNDNITDHWDSFGTGDMLQKVNRLAERFRWTDEFRLSRALRFITGGMTPLDDQGNRVWPRVGDTADAVFVQASCSAEAIARQSEKAAVMFQGNLVWQKES
jgi:cytosine/adenosine deaminase-related metal-dependent hydrolase